MKHKITVQPYDYTCGDGCCSEYNEIWCLNDKEIYRGPQKEEAILNILTELGIKAEILFLVSDDGEEVAGFDNFD